MTVDWNGARFDPASATGGYESWFMRGNHPTLPRAFWIRYTSFRRKGAAPGDGEGELWASWFDGDAAKPVFAYTAFPFSRCEFGRAGIETRIGDAWLREGALVGEAGASPRIAWDLTFAKAGPALLLYEERRYASSFPKAKVVTPAPGAVFRGTISVNGRAESIDGWSGSQSHNWGPQHTERYTWAQVSGFDGAPDAFLECATARVRVGPFLTPPMSVAILRIDGREIRFDSMRSSLLARARSTERSWDLRISQEGSRLSATLEAPEERFVVLDYRNPPGGVKVCRNSKIAACRVVLEEPGKPLRVFETKNRAAFELLS